MLSLHGKGIQFKTKSPKFNSVCCSLPISYDLRFRTGTAQLSTGSIQFSGSSRGVTAGRKGKLLDGVGLPLGRAELIPGAAVREFGFLLDTKIHCCYRAHWFAEQQLLILALLQLDINPNNASCVKKQKGMYQEQAYKV